MAVDNRTRARRRRRFTPFAPPVRPPAGTYDPVFDQQERAADRGYGDLQQDTTRQRERNQDDLTLDTGDVIRGRDRSLHDLLTSYERGGSDLTRDFGRARSDLDLGYARGNEDRGLRYDALGRSQTGAARAAHLGGGVLAASAAVRAQNRGREQGRSDTDYGTGTGRLSADLEQAKTRLQQDFSLQQGRIGEDATNAVSRLGLGFTRGSEDLATQLSRGGRENAFLKQDLGESRFAQAAQSGYEPPQKPKGEMTRRGVTYRRVRGGFLLPNGRVVDIHTLRRLYH